MFFTRALLFLQAAAILPNVIFAELHLSKPCPGGPETELWVLAGQSNMAGNAVMEAPIEPDQGIFLFNMDNSWIEARAPLHRLFESVAPVHKNIFVVEKKEMTSGQFEKRRELSKKNPIGRVGPGLFFAKHLRQSIDRPVGLIACAHGGTTMKQWDPSLKSLGNNSLYGAMLERIEMAGGNIKGVLWYQGESEGINEESSDYDTVFLNFIDQLRSDTKLPDLPIIFVQIGRWTRQNDPRGDSWEQVRELQRQAAQQRENVFMVSAIDLPLDDEIHLSFEGQQRLGRRLAEVALSQVYQIPGHATPIELDSIEVIEKGDRNWPEIHVRYKGVNGTLQAPGRPWGFEVRSVGAENSTSDLYRIDFDPENPDVLILRMAKSIPENAQLVYGPGLNPYCNIVDDGDISIPAFGPLDLFSPDPSGHKE